MEKLADLRGQGEEGPLQVKAYANIFLFFSEFQNYVSENLPPRLSFENSRAATDRNGKECTHPRRSPTWMRPPFSRIEMKEREF